MATDSRSAPEGPGSPVPPGVSGQAGPLGQRLTVGASATQVADAVVTMWQEIDLALHPIIGHRGVLALYNRSLRQASAHHPWLAIDHAGALAAVDTTALRSALTRQPPDQALAAGTALLQTFRDLLRSLIGDSLTGRLLGSIWGPTPAAAPAQDKAP